MQNPNFSAGVWIFHSGRFVAVLYWSPWISDDSYVFVMHPFPPLASFFGFWKNLPTHTLLIIAADANPQGFFFVKVRPSSWNCKPIRKKTPSVHLCIYLLAENAPCSLQMVFTVEPRLPQSGSHHTHAKPFLSTTLIWPWRLRQPHCFSWFVVALWACQGCQGWLSTVAIRHVWGVWNWDVPVFKGLSGSLKFCC